MSYEQILLTLRRFPDWFKAIALVGAIVILLFWMSNKSEAQQQRIFELKADVSEHKARITALEKEVEAVSRKIDRIEGKIDILLTRLK